MRRFLAFFVVLVTSLAATACVVYEDGSDDEYVDWYGMNAEYHAAMASFPYQLPEGIDFPADAPFKPDEDDEAEFRVGIGESWIYEFAECAYVSAVVANQDGDFAAAMSAVDSIEELYQAPYYQQIWPELSDNWEKVLDMARRGDFWEINEFYHDACVAGWMGFK